MNTHIFHWRMGIVMIALLVGLMGTAQAQSKKTSGATNIESLNTKLDRLIQQQGGRYVFLVSAEGDLWRLDTYEGKVAILNLVSGAEWDTLDVPEKTLRTGNAFYEQFVQKLNRIDFNSN
ncbi:hypothetical protein [Cerasicoccus frondis]|uniref:hypothetical protein n=1 Tax=Cerasicoccus frondis TaxID=490090 RepID=UPI002852B2A3|nr:hypothetical protein [Cerasicoccus frondis]